MKHKKLVISGAIVLSLTVTGIIAAMDNNSQPVNNEVPVTVVKPAEVVQPQVTTDTTSSSPTSSPKKTTSSQSATTNDTPVETPVPKVYFFANSDQYPGSGTFVLSSFTTEPNWNVTFNYTCDTGQVFGVITIGSQNIIMNHVGTFGPFVGTAGQVKVVVPADQNCTWDVSVS